MGRVQACAVLLGLLVLALGKREEIPMEAKLDLPEYCSYLGYETETHIVQTEDQYNLKLFRILGKDTPKPSTFSSWFGQRPGSRKDAREVVLLQHGLVDSSDTWVVNEPKLAPGLVMADRGYDVWLGNVRGNKYSDKALNPQKKHFWKFSFDQMAQFDLPAMVDYIRMKTGADKISYVGHSQGTTAMFAAQSMDYGSLSQKIKHFFALGPVAYLTHQNSPAVNFLSSPAVVTALKSGGVKGLLFSTPLMSRELSQTCTRKPGLCEWGLKEVSEEKPEVNNLGRLPVIMGHFPAGTSLQNVLHFNQYLRSDRFAMFDYGKKLNTVMYNSTEPPLYPLANVKVPVHLFVGKYDRLATIPDAQRIFQ